MMKRTTMLDGRHLISHVRERASLYSYRLLIHKSRKDRFVTDVMCSVSWIFMGVYIDGLVQERRLFCTKLSICCMLLHNVSI